MKPYKLDPIENEPIFAKDQFYISFESMDVDVTCKDTGLRLAGGIQMDIVRHYPTT